MDAMLSGTAVRATFRPGRASASTSRGVSEFAAVEGQTREGERAQMRSDAALTPHDGRGHSEAAGLLQEQNATSLRCVLRNTPGITMSIRPEGGSGGTSSGDNDA